MKTMTNIQTNPVKIAIEHLRVAKFSEAHKVLATAYHQHPSNFELMRVANLISPCGMINQALDALLRIEGSIDAYLNNPPPDEEIGIKTCVAARLPSKKIQP